MSMYTYVHTYTGLSMYTGMGLATDVHVWFNDAAQICRPRYINVGLGIDRQAAATTYLQNISQSTTFGTDVRAQIHMQMYIPQYRCTDAQKSRDLQALVQIYIYTNILENEYLCTCVWIIDLDIDFQFQVYICIHVYYCTCTCTQGTRAQVQV